MKLIQREYYLNKLINVIGTPDIIIITGVRRSGKSKLMDQFEENGEQDSEQSFDGMFRFEKRMK